MPIATIDLSRTRWYRPTADEWQAECAAWVNESFWWFLSDYWWRGNFALGKIINGWRNEALFRQN